jgi:hypothetical protein
MSEKIRVGNDIDITWSLIDEEEQPYVVEGRDVSVEVVIADKKRYRVKDLDLDGNSIHFVYWGKDQKYTGICQLKFIENDGEKEMVTFDIPDAFTLVAHSWQTASAPENERVQISFVTVTSNLMSKVGPAAGFGEITASVDENSGTPYVDVETSGPNSAKNISFSFHNLRGESIYDFAVKYGHFVGTEEEFEAEYQAALQAARDAATAANATNEEVIAAEALRVVAERNRELNESARSDAEATRVSSEQSRENNEVARRTAESARATAEYGRESAESSRVADEQSRVSAETDRVAAESGRAIAEAGRQSAETARSTAEASRVSAEQSRADAESARSSAESSRVAAESAREGAEAGRVSAETAREEQATLDHERAESDHESIAEMQDDVDSLNARVAEMQPSFPWSDDFLWMDEQAWPKENGGGGGGDVDILKLLHSAPTFMKRGGKRSDTWTYHVYHPLMDQEGAEIVLMRYSKRNRKKARGVYKKGFGVASGGKHSEYFVFSAETSYADFYDFCNSNLTQQNLGRHFGIALRIPNPDYTGPATLLKNATFRGVQESLYSDILPIKVSHDGVKDVWGIGLI